MEEGDEVIGRVGEVAFELIEGCEVEIVKLLVPEDRVEGETIGEVDEEVVAESLLVENIEPLVLADWIEEETADESEDEVLIGRVVVDTVKLLQVEDNGMDDET